MADEALTLNGTALNDGTSFTLESFSAPPPRKKPNWLTGPDVSGSILLEDPYFDNREITVRLRVVQQSTMNLALDKVGVIVDELEEAERNPNGVPMTWTPAGSTRTLTFYVLSGEIDDVPVSWTGDDVGWFVRAPVMTVKMTCRPFGYGSASTIGPANTSTPFVTLELPSVGGDVPAEGRLIVTAGSSQSRKHLEWGLEQRYYNSGTSLLVDSDNMTTSGFTGTGTTLSGAYDPNASGNSVVQAALYPSVVAVAGTGTLSHVGTFRVKARVQATVGDVKLRLSWQSADGPFTSNDYASVDLPAAWREVDLGLITIPPVDLGTQKWSGRLEAYSPSRTTLSVDYLILVPAGEGYGKARATYSSDPGVTTGQDSFTSTTAGSGLNARVATLGGTWATSGSATDLTFADFGTLETVTRATTSDASPRFAVLGATVYTDMEVRSLIYQSAFASARTGVIARWVDSSNYLYAFMGGNELNVGQVVAGVTTTLASQTYTHNAGYWYDIRLRVYASGNVTAELYYGGARLFQVNASSSALATGGALDDGKGGLYDVNTSAGSTTRYYDDFYTSTPPAEQIVCYSGRTCEIRHDSAIRQDSTGVYYGQVPSYRGARFFVPPAGAEARASRVLVKARRTDVDVSSDANVTDSTTFSVTLTPRYLAVPRV